MIALYVEAPYATFRKSFARTFVETYRLPPPATLYGMLLSTVGERYRNAHNGVRLAFAYRRIPRVATTLRKLSRLKYGVAAKQSSLGNAPDYVETLCGIELLCWVDSSNETTAVSTLEQRLEEALRRPGNVERYGLVSLGLSDDLVNELSIVERYNKLWHRLVVNEKEEGVQLEPLEHQQWHRLIPDPAGSLELPIWVDHLGSANTRWQRYELDEEPVRLEEEPGSPAWPWTEMVTPLQAEGVK